MLVSDLVYVHHIFHFILGSYFHLSFVNIVDPDQMSCFAAQDWVSLFSSVPCVAHWAPVGHSNTLV